MNKSVLLWVSISTLSLLSACGGQTSSSSMPLTADEEAGLVYMREEEELARDLYLDIFDLKPALTVFQTISNNSETQHAAKMLTLLNTYQVNDPSTGLRYTYTDPALQAMYTQLLSNAAGGNDVAALKVGALVEEVDIQDINEKKAMVDAAHQDIITTYDNLLCGSRNHLRSFVSQIELLSGAPYTIQVPALSAEVTAILAGAQEQCGR
ncbi:MAG: hypothetical protein AUK35_10740 [Zetaproteobacteria bacterium CG2_30_46_52]|nr:MAG: hypothetical protein AUK35_10740 [Zetaproteobacteria bacterium CG2_30_46_52]